MCDCSFQLTNILTWEPAEYSKTQPWPKIDIAMETIWTLNTLTNQKHNRKETKGLSCQWPSLTRRSICVAIADERVTCLPTEKHTLHPGNYMTKLVTTRWVQGVRVMQKDSRRKGTSLPTNDIDWWRKYNQMRCTRTWKKLLYKETTAKHWLWFLRTLRIHRTFIHW